MRAVVLAGGLGTRLGALIAGRNKPMALVAGKPFLELPLLQLKKNGLTDILLCVGHRGDLVRDYFGTGAAWGLNLGYSQETELRGTAGALKLAEHQLGSDFVVLNGDSLFDIPLAELIAFHAARGAVATLALARTDQPERFGNVEIDDRGCVLRFAEKRQSGRGGLINGGVYVFRRQVLDMVPVGRPVSLERAVFPALVGHGLWALPFDGFFLDIGLPESFRLAQAQVERLRAATA
jgi:NDP-sugar pyrophosphorylase family protein